MKKFIILNQPKQVVDSVEYTMEVFIVDDRYFYMEKAWDALCGLTGGFIGAHSKNSEWMWKVPTSPMKDKDGEWASTLGSDLYDLETKALSAMLDHRVLLEKTSVSKALYKKLKKADIRIMLETLLNENTSLAAYHDMVEILEKSVSSEDQPKQKPASKKNS